MKIDRTDILRICNGVLIDAYENEEFQEVDVIACQRCNANRPVTKPDNDLVHSPGCVVLLAERIKDEVNNG